VAASLTAGRFELIDRVAEGQQGEVYRATDRWHGTTVALKFFGERSAATRTRSWADLRHPNIVRVLDQGFSDGRPYLAMEYVDGPGLREAFLSCSEADFRGLLSGMCLGLQAAHARGVHHGDLKPANVLLQSGPGGSLRPKLSDFGIRDGDAGHADGFSGTLAYAAPELLGGGPVDQRADLYSLGACIYEAVTGSSVFPRDSLREVVQAHLADAPPDPRETNPSVSGKLSRVVTSLLAKNPTDRPPSAGHVIELLGGKGLPWRVGEPGWVGRDRQVGFIRGLSDSASRSQGGMVLVVGERGTGKSMLLERLYLEYGSLGLPRAHVRCGEDGPAEMTLLARVTALAREKGADDLPRSWALEEPESLSRTFLDVARSLAGSSRMLFVIIDDLGRAEEPFLRFLVALLPPLASERVLVVASVDKAGVSKLRGTIPSLLELPQVRRVSLRPFTRGETERLLATVLCRSNVDGELLTLVHRVAEGNPGLAREVVHHLVREGCLALERGEWVVKALPDLPRLADGVGVISEAAVRSVELPHRKVLGTLALMGGTAATEMLAGVVGCSREGMGETLEILEDAGLVVRSGGTCTIRHRLVAQAAMSSLRGTEKKRIHAAAADAIDSRWPGDSSRAGELARHLAGCGRDREALSKALGAADRALEQKRLGRALELYKLAESCLEAGDRRGRALSWRGQAACYSALGRFAQAVERLTGVLELGEAVDMVPGETVPVRVALVRALANIGRRSEAHEHLEAALSAAEPGSACRAEALSAGAQLAAKDGEWRRAETLSRGCLEEARGSSNASLEAEAENCLGVALMMLGALEEARPHLQRSYVLREELGEALGAGRCAMNLGIVHRRLGQYDTARKHLEDSLARFESARAVSWEAEARNLQGLIELWAGLPHHAVPAFEHSMQLARRSGVWYTAGVALNNLGLAQCSQGEWGRGLRSYREAYAMGRRKGNRYLKRLASSNLGDLYFSMGDLDVAESWYARAKETAQGEDDPLAIGMCELSVGKLRREQGRLEEADALLERARTALSESGDSRCMLYLRCEVAELRLSQGRMEEAVEAAEVAWEKLGEAGAVDEAVVARTLGKAMARAGRNEEAATAFRRCLELLEPSGAVEETALARLEVGQWLRERGHVPGFRAAETYLVAAKESFVKLGARRRADEAHEVLSGLLSHSPSGLALPVGDAQKLRSLYRMVALVNSASTSEGLLEQVLDLAVHAVEGERGLVILLDRESGALKVQAKTEVDGATITDACRISETVVKEVAGAGKPVFSPDALHDARFSDHDSIQLNRIACFVCVPLALREKIIGTIYVDARSLGRHFSEDDVAYLCAFAHQAAIAMENLRLREELEKENEYLQRQLRKSYAFDSLVGRSARMQSVYAMMDAVLESPVTVLLEGETGTGKELIARAIHYNGHRSKGKFVPVDCGALPDSLLESELFGHAKGAFTGAVRSTSGLLYAADGGTIFLDEITDMSSSLQSKLLRVLQTGEMKPLGRAAVQRVDVRVLSATNKDLEEEMKAGRFREDLYYRLKVVTIRVPSLRDRRDDIPLLATHFLMKYNKRLKKDVRAFSDDVMAHLCTREWPGNVRELEHVVEAAVALCPGRVITLETLSRAIAPRQPSTLPPADAAAAPTLRDAKRSLERHYVLRALQTTGWNIRKAAERIGVDRRQMQRLIQRHELGRSATA
jgi:Nif-specific regulatory protein